MHNSWTRHRLFLCLSLTSVAVKIIRRVSLSAQLMCTQFRSNRLMFAEMASEKEQNTGNFDTRLKSTVVAGNNHMSQKCCLRFILSPVLLSLGLGREAPGDRLQTVLVLRVVVLVLRSVVLLWSRNHVLNQLLYIIFHVFFVVSN